MTQEEKQLLLVDLCARLPYGVVCHIVNDSDFEDILQPYDGKVSFGLLDRFRGHHFDLKPYLRSMSSMTEEEVKEFAALESIDVVCGNIKITCVELSVDAIDWLNKKMFDYRGLIPMGLALEAPERMYKEK